MKIEDGLVTDDSYPLANLKSLQVDPSLITNPFSIFLRALQFHGVVPSSIPFGGKVSQFSLDFMLSLAFVPSGIVSGGHKPSTKT
jgi:hypothetical protein